MSAATLKGAFAAEDDMASATALADERPPVLAAVGSPLRSLRERRAELLAELHYDLEVPRLPGPVIVRFTPITQDQVTKINRDFKDYKGGDLLVRVNAAVLARCCVGVFERAEDGTPISVDDRDRMGTWPRFDTQLAEILGITADGAFDVVRALYATDGDVLSTSDKLATWSGMQGDVVREAHAGE